MLSKAKWRGFTRLLCCLVLGSLLTVSAFAVNGAEYEAVSAEEAEIVASAFENPVVQDFQAQIDEMLKYYLGKSDVTADEVPALAAAMSQEELSDAYWAIMILVEDMGYALDDGLMTEVEGTVLSYVNPAMTAFSDYVMEYAPEVTDGSLYAATSGSHTPVPDVTVSVSDATDNSMTDGAVTVTAKGSAGVFGINASAKTATITIYNDSESTATLSFDWAATSINQLVIDGTTYTAASGSFSKVLDAGASITATITTAKNSTVNKLVMSNFALTVAKNSSAVTFDYDSALGSVTVAGNATSDGATVDIAVAGAELVATPVSGATFIGWYNTADNSVLSRDSSYTLKPANDMTVTAAFGNASNGWFLVDGAYLIKGLTEACAKGTTIVLMNDYTLPAGNYTIPDSDTLLIPYDAANTLITNNMGNYLLDSNTGKSVYRKLTMSSGANITVSGGGAICVGSQTYRQMTGQAGPYGAISMTSGSNITIQNGGFLYAWGYITGSGTVTIESNGTVYENLFVDDYPGSANTTSSLYYKGIFPMRAFTVRNVEVPMTFQSGGKEYIFYSLYGSNFAVGYKNGYSLLIGGADTSDPPLFQLNAQATLEKSYSGGKHYLLISGSSAINELKVKINVDITSSATTGVPIPSNFHVTLKSGGSMTTSDSIILTEGSTFVIEENATLDTGTDNLYVMDAEEDLGAISPIDVDAVLDVNGTLITGGGFYTSTSGAAIKSSGGTGVVQVSGSSTATSVNMKTGKDVNSSISITPAKLKNGNGIYVQSATGTYVYTGSGENGKWVCQHTSIDGDNHKCNGCSATCVAHIDGDENQNHYVELQTALDQENKTVNLCAEYTVDSGEVVDLKGCAVVGKVTVVASTTNTVGGKIIDSKTDDFNVSDAGYITNYTGTIGTVCTDTGTDKHYVAVTVGDKTQFHRVASTVSAFRFFLVDGASYLGVEGTFRGSKAALLVLDNMGFETTKDAGTATETMYTESGNAIDTIVPTNFADGGTVAVHYNFKVDEKDARTNLNASYSVLSRLVYNSVNADSDPRVITLYDMLTYFVNNTSDATATQKAVISSYLDG